MTHLLFQYQKGAIKTGENFTIVITDVLPFQYQKGAIKTPRRLSDTTTLARFNTKKVRLKLLKRDIEASTLFLFQYQKGAIKTGNHR